MYSSPPRPGFLRRGPRRPRLQRRVGDQSHSRDGFSWIPGRASRISALLGAKIRARFLFLPLILALFFACGTDEEARGWAWRERVPLRAAGCSFIAESGCRGDSPNYWLEFEAPLARVQRGPLAVGVEMQPSPETGNCAEHGDCPRGGYCVQAQCWRSSAGASEIAAFEKSGLWPSSSLWKHFELVEDHTLIARARVALSGAKAVAIFAGPALREQSGVSLAPRGEALAIFVIDAAAPDPTKGVVHPGLAPGRTSFEVEGPGIKDDEKQLEWWLESKAGGLLKLWDQGPCARGWWGQERERCRTLGWIDPRDTIVQRSVDLIFDVQSGESEVVEVSRRRVLRHGAAVEGRAELREGLWRLRSRFTSAPDKALAYAGPWIAVKAEASPRLQWLGGGFGGRCRYADLQSEGEGRLCQQQAGEQRCRPLAPGITRLWWRPGSSWDWSFESKAGEWLGLDAPPQAAKQGPFEGEQAPGLELEISAMMVHPKGPEARGEWVELAWFSPEQEPVAGHTGANLWLVQRPFDAVLKSYREDPKAWVEGAGLGQALPSFGVNASGRIRLLPPGAKPAVAPTQSLYLDRAFGGRGLANRGEALTLFEYRLGQPPRWVSQYGGWVDLSSAKHEGQAIHRVAPGACDSPGAWKLEEVSATGEDRGPGFFR